MLSEANKSGGEKSKPQNIRASKKNEKFKANYKTWAEILIPECE